MTDVLKLVLDLYGRQLRHSEAQPRGRVYSIEHRRLAGSLNTRKAPCMLTTSTASGEYFGICCFWKCSSRAKGLSCKWETPQNKGYIFLPSKRSPARGVGENVTKGQNYLDYCLDRPERGKCLSGRCLISAQQQRLAKTGGKRSGHQRRVADLAHHVSEKQNKTKQKV